MVIVKHVKIVELLRCKRLHLRPHYNYIGLHRLAALRKLEVACLVYGQEVLGCFVLLAGCTQPQTTSHQVSQPVGASQKSITDTGLGDANATAETRALYAHLQNIKKHHIFFG